MISQATGIARGIANAADAADTASATGRGKRVAREEEWNPADLRYFASLRSVRFRRWRKPK
jgi:hypothetical protein